MSALLKIVDQRSAISLKSRQRPKKPVVSSSNMADEHQGVDQGTIRPLAKIRAHGMRGIAD